MVESRASEIQYSLELHLENTQTFRNENGGIAS